METFDPKGALAAPVLPALPRAAEPPEPRRRRFWARLFGRGGGRDEYLPEVIPPNHDPPDARARLVTPSAALAAGGPAIWLRFPN